jgi:hypothetical protein
MRPFKILTLVYFCFCNVKTFGQSEINKCLDKDLFTGNKETLDSLTESLINKLPVKDLYLIGEAHQFSPNNYFQFSLIKALNIKKVYNVANELPHATCFLFNQYLETGNENILNELKPKATYEILKKVRLYNLTKPLNQRVKYYGIDYLNAQYDFAKFLLSLKIINDKIKSEKLPLEIFIEKYLKKNKLENIDVQQLNDTIKLFLTIDSIKYKEHYGEYFYDLKLMASNFIGYRPNRDSDIFKSFKILHANLKAINKENPRFLSFYGIGHLFNFGNKLNDKKESPVFNNIIRVGISYYHCKGGWGWTEDSYKNLSLYNLKKKSKEKIELQCKENKWEVGYISNSECISFKSGLELDAIMIFNNYGDRRMNSWKFD